MTSVCIVNDTTRFHLGSATVMGQIFKTMERLDWTINASFLGNSFMFEKREPPIDAAIIERSDIIVINGEGSVHHDQPMAVFLMDFIERYRHKKVCLINTLWQHMGPESEAKLQHAAMVVARDPQSFRSIQQFYKGPLHLAPDLSSRDIPPLAPMDDQGIIFGGFYWKQHAKIAGVDVEKLALKAMATAPTVDLTKEGWHLTVNRLRHAKLLVTGKFHEVMAAIVARCPFVFCPVSTHKIEMLGEFAGEKLVPLDMRLTEAQYRASFEAAIADKAYYERLFDAVNGATARFDLEASLKAVLAT